MQTTDSSHRPARHSTYYIDEGDLVVRAEDTLYRFHSFHLQRATNYFDANIPALRDAPAIEGGSDGNPLVLDDVKSQDFEHLMWFYYESAYKWSGVVDPALTAKWESVLLLAEKFDMRQAAKVACYALGRAEVLGDVRKISLCVRHGLGKDWVIKELKRVIERDAHLTEEEGQELGIKTTILLAASREACRYKLSSMPASCRNLPTIYCSCGGYNRNLTCGGGVHKCTSCSRIMMTCPERDRFYTENFKQPRIDKTVEKMVLPQPGTIPAKLETAGLEHSAAKADLFIKIGASVFTVHSYHLKQASQVFRDMLDLPREDITSEGRSQEHPIILDISPRAFESFLWFLYCSPYEWSYKADPSLSAEWEDILLVADMFNMEEVCRVATYALDHHGGLPDIRKISLCVRHEVDRNWAFEAIKRVCGRQNALTKEEARAIGLDMTANIASVREAAYQATYGGGISVSLAALEKLVREMVL